VYKHAISTIVPARAVKLNHGEARAQEQESGNE